jgi:hypothetical protein
MSGTKGNKTALEMALAEQDAPPVEEQLELLGAPVNEKVLEARAERTRVGRPPGSLNRRTSEMARYLLSKYTSPLEVLMQIATAPVSELAASIGCSKLEALQEKRLAAIACKDHLHSKMPIAVDLTHEKIIHLTIDEGAPVDPDAGNDNGDDVLTLTATVIREGKLDGGA